jgi:hypothetical protein
MDESDAVPDGGVSFVDALVSVPASNIVGKIINAPGYMAGAYVIDTDSQAAGAPFAQSAPWSHAVMRYGSMFSGFSSYLGMCAL